MSLYNFCKSVLSELLPPKPNQPKPRISTKYVNRKNGSAEMYCAIQKRKHKKIPHILLYKFSTILIFHGSI